MFLMQSHYAPNLALWTTATRLRGARPTYPAHLLFSMFPAPLKMPAQAQAIEEQPHHLATAPCAGVKVKPCGCYRNLDPAGRGRLLERAGSGGMPLLPHQGNGNAEASNLILLFTKRVWFLNRSYREDGYCPVLTPSSLVCRIDWPKLNVLHF
jgi:hypothetical protein